MESTTGSDAWAALGTPGGAYSPPMPAVIDAKALHLPADPPERARGNLRRPYIDGPYVTRPVEQTADS